MNLEWKESYSVGVKEIDSQHKYFIETINQFGDAVISGNKKKIDSVLDKLLKYTVFHFDTEEKYFDEFNFDGAAEHKAKHAEMRDEVNGYVAEMKTDEIATSIKLVEFLHRWLDEHLVEMDHKYVNCFKEHGLK